MLRRKEAIVAIIVFVVGTLTKGALFEFGKKLAPGIQTFMECKKIESARVCAGKLLTKDAPPPSQPSAPLAGGIQASSQGGSNAGR